LHLVHLDPNSSHRTASVHRRVPDPLGSANSRRSSLRPPGDRRVPDRPEAPRGRPRRRFRQGLSHTPSSRKGNSSMKIDSIGLQLSRIPLPKGPWGDQIHKVTDIEIILADITTDTGLVGTGFSHTSGVGGRMMIAALEELVPSLIGREVNPRGEIGRASWRGRGW